jgi:hypothetical protein
MASKRDQNQIASQTNNDFNHGKSSDEQIRPVKKNLVTVLTNKHIYNTSRPSAQVFVEEERFSSLAPE